MSNSYGVPQGLIRGPILFNILINCILKSNSSLGITTTTAIHEDVQLLFSGTPNNPVQLKIYAETSRKKIQEWYSTNGLKMNSNRTQCILFATPNDNKRTESLQITMDGAVTHAYGR